MCTVNRLPSQHPCIPYPALSCVNSSTHGRARYPAMSISKLPRELMLDVVDQLSIESLSRLLCTCHSLHQLLGPALDARIATQQLASSILEWGIRHNILPNVHLALARNAAWHIEGEHGLCYSALADACDRNYLEIIAVPMTHYGPTIHINLTPSGGYCHVNQLEVGIRCNNLARTTLLLEGGASPNRKIWYGYKGNDKTPIGIAAMYGSAEIAEVLIKHGAEVQYADRSLCYAVDSGRWDVAKVLLREGPSLWENLFEWSERCPLGGRTAVEIEAWVVSGAAYMLQEKEKTSK